MPPAAAPLRDRRHRHARKAELKPSAITHPREEMNIPVEWPSARWWDQRYHGVHRMKAGTATKLILNMLTTTAMIRLGKVYGNMMVDLQMTSKSWKNGPNGF